MHQTTDTDSTSSPTDASVDVAPTRQCGRCRRAFPIDVGTHPMELRDWWACPNCIAALMPGRHTPTSHADKRLGSP